MFPDFYYGLYLRPTVEKWVMDGGNGSVGEGNSCFWTKHSVIRFAA